jgi:uncharacterized protein (DUF2342 family)
MNRHITRRVQDKEDTTARDEFTTSAKLKEETFSLSEQQNVMDVTGPSDTPIEVALANMRAEYQAKISELAASFASVLSQKDQAYKLLFDEHKRAIDEHKNSINSMFQMVLEMQAKLSGMATTSDLRTAITAVTPKIPVLMCDRR